METMTAADLIDLLRVLAEEMPAHQEELRDLDAQMGDGDRALPHPGMKASPTAGRAAGRGLG